MDFVAARDRGRYADEMDNERAAFWAGVSGCAAAVFALSCVAQFNDPDPLGWVLLYGAAATLAGLGSRRDVRRPAMLVMAVCGLWMVALWVGGLPDEPQPMKLGPQSGWLADEVVREGGGLVLVGVWMGVLVARRPPSSVE